MTDDINHVEKLERMIERLADSVLELSDEAIVAEVGESGTDPQEEAERIRLLLQQVSNPEEVVNGNQRTACQRIGKPVR
jgi:hypothetical protein